MKCCLKQEKEERVMMIYIYIYLYFNKKINKRYYNLATSNEVVIIILDNRIKVEEIIDIDV